MTAEEVNRIMGQLDYRWFNRNVEEWEYCKWLPGFNLSFKDRVILHHKVGADIHFHLDKVSFFPDS